MVIEAKDLIIANSTLTAGLLIFLTLTPDLRSKVQDNKITRFKPVKAAGVLMGIFSASSILAVGLTQYIWIANTIFAIGLIVLTILIIATGILLQK